MYSTDEKKDEIFSAWHEQADSLLPEFGFRRNNSGNWKSSTGYKATGEAGAPGKVYYYANTPFMLKDYTRGTVSLLQYIKQRERIEETGAALQYMAAQAGIKYERFRTENEEQEYAQKIQRAELLEAANTFFIDCLTHAENEYAKGDQAEGLRDYLKGRGYTAKDIRPPVSEYDADATYMEIGFIPSYEALRKHLEKAGYSTELIAETIAQALPEGVGTTHTITFPFRTLSGHIAGFAYRLSGNERSKVTYSKNAPPKYLYDKGLKKGSLLFNFRRTNNKAQKIIVVEGLLDAFIAYARGIEGVVGIGGAEITEQQARNILKYSGGNVTLCLDSDEAGKRGTDTAIRLLQEIAGEEGIKLRLFIARLPEGVKDADELITKEGAEAFRKVLWNSSRDYDYQYKEITERYEARRKPIGENGELKHTAEDLQEFYDEVVNAASFYTDPLDRSAFLQDFISEQSTRFSKDGIEEAAERIRRSKEQRKQEEDLKKIAYGLLGDIKKGSAPSEVISSVKLGVERIEQLRAADLLQLDSYEELEERAMNSGENMLTGYTDLDRGFRYPSGSLTLIAGRTSHGKTAFMLNSILRQAQMKEYADRKFYFFSYEEASEKLLLKMLNSLIGFNISTDILLSSEYDKLSNEEALQKYIRLRRAKKQPAERRIEEKRELLRELKNSGRLIITDKRYSVEQLKSIILAEAKKSNFGTAYIDYAQRIKTEREFRERRTQIDYISAELCETAILINRPLIIGAQLNRSAAAKGNAASDHRPRLEQLKESGALEEDANSVLTVYNENAERVEAGATEGSPVVNLEIQAVKNRDGRRNYRTVLHFNQATRKIDDLTREQVKKILQLQEDKRKKKKDEAAAKKAKNSEDNNGKSTPIKKEEQYTEELIDDDNYQPF